MHNDTILKQGDKFNRLTIVREDKKDSHGRKFYLCNCDCGNTKVIGRHGILSGRAKSCGCYMKEQSSKYNSNRGNPLIKENHSEYSSYVRMKSRCLVESNNRFNNYGGRGIKICDRWLDSFENFLKDMGKKPTEKHSIDRIDVNGDYTPDNCKWSTNSEQQRNKRGNLLVNVNGKIVCAKEASEILGINYNTLFQRVKRGSKNTLNIDSNSKKRMVMNMETGIYYNSIREAAISHNIAPQRLVHMLNRNKKTNLCLV